MSNIKEILDFILNRASEQDMTVIAEAMKRRGNRKSNMLGGMDIQSMAAENSKMVTQQMGLDQGQIRNMVRDFAVKIIAQNAPELKPDQIEVLLDDWVPDGSVGGRQQEVDLPADVMQTMISQFLSFSKNSMPLQEQEKLRAEMPEWYERYWKMFPDNVQYVLKDYIEEKITEDEYNVRMEDILSKIS